MTRTLWTLLALIGLAVPAAAEERQIGQIGGAVKRVQQARDLP